MSDIDKDDATIEARAGEWILRREREDWSPADREALERWLSADSRHREAFLRLIELWRLAGGLKVWRPIDGSIRSDVLSNAKRGTTSKPRWHLALAAGIVALTTAASTLLYVQQYRDVYTTQVGGYQRLLLDDGSKVQLNTDTRIRVRLSDADRRVELLKGEAFFDIAPDAGRPFYVAAAKMRVRVLGTAFSVRLHETSRVDVLVTQGRVSVHEEQSPDSPPTASPEESEESLLEAGQVAQARANGIHVAKIEPVEMTRRLSWQSGTLRFKSESLAAVVAEFNRYNRKRLEIVDPKLAGLEVGGNFRTDDLRSFVAAMRAVRGIQIEERADRILLSSESP